MKIIFATNNLNKLKEIQQLVGEKFNLVSLKDIGFTEEIPEDHPTLQQNAIQKAQYIWDRYKTPCFADDTGLEVEALNGEPGVYSARYAGSDCIAENNMQKLLSNLTNKPNRSAQFRTVVAFINDNTTTTFEGTVQGTIATKKLGEEGFGYDPIFIPNNLPNGGNKQQLSFAQIPLSDKNLISHRGKAIRKFVASLSELLD